MRLELTRVTLSHIKRISNTRLGQRHSSTVSLSSLAITARSSPPSGPSLDSLFCHTTSRWLCNEDQHRKVLYTPFNVQALESIACQAAAAQRCVSWEKIGEGAFNKVFHIHLDNGGHVAIRIPCPVMANVGLSVASEVATMTYVSECWADDERVAKPPRVLSWSASYDNPAQTPYIILDYAPGVTLATRWAQIHDDVAINAVTTLMNLESSLHRHRFSQHGSLFFAEDVPEELRERPLYKLPLEDLPEQCRKVANKYRVGPIVHREWWRGPYGRMIADRGPWQDAETMVVAAARMQLQFLNSLADFPTKFVRSKASDVPLLRRLLQMCISIAPYLIPHERGMADPTLTHPDLTLSNLIVPTEGDISTATTIDWHGATLSPFFVQCGLPPAIQYSQELIPIPADGSVPSLPDHFDTLSDEMQEVYRVQLRLANRYMFYTRFQRLVDPNRHQAWHMPSSAARGNILLSLPRCISDGPMELRGYLIELQQNWDVIIGSLIDAPEHFPPCPIDFSEAEMAAHAAAQETDDEYHANVQRLYDELRCDKDTDVAPEDFEAAKELMEKRRAEWDEREMKGPFPIYEGAHSWKLS